MLAHGTSAAVSRASQLLGSSPASAPSMTSRSAAMFSVRAAQSLKRGSLSASARPSVFMRFANCFSVRTARTMNPSLQRNRFAVGLRLTEPLPICRCSMPATVYSETGPGMKASAASSMATSTNWPRPVCVRW